MMDPAYVEDGSFKTVRDAELGAYGRRIRHRVYVLKENPDQREGADISHSVVIHWALSGFPNDAVFHLGRFHRVTVV